MLEHPGRIFRAARTPSQYRSPPGALASSREARRRALWRRRTRPRLPRAARLSSNLLSTTRHPAAPALPSSTSSCYSFRRGKLI